MRPENLKSPYKLSERKVLIEDRVWYVPLQGTAPSDFSFPGWDCKTFFGNSNPVHIEYCSGNGTWIAEKASENPLINWVAVEKKFERVKKIWSKIKNRELSNLIVISGEALNATRCFFPSSTIAEIYVNFPDPWPKCRHAKHRLIQPEFINEVARILRENGSLSLVTDAPDYSMQMIEVLCQSPAFNSCYPDPYYTEEMSNYGSSYFEELWREKGKVIRYHQFKKKAI